MDPLKLTVRVVRGRWFTVFASFLIMSSAGGTYLFGIYSAEMKSTFGYDQQTLNTLSFFKNLGGNVGIIAGLMNEIMPPWFILLIGAVTNFGGHFMIYLSLTKKIAQPKFWQMCMYICIGTNSQNFSNTGSLVPCVKNFPRNRGIVLGLLKGFVGLSGAIMTQIYLALYGDHPKSLVLLIAWLPTIISITFLNTFRLLPPEKESEGYNQIRVFYYFLYASLALAGYLMTVIILQEEITFNHTHFIFAACFTLLLLFLPLAVVIREEILQYSSTSPPLPLSSSEPKLTSTSTSPPSSFGSFASRTISILKPPERGMDYTIIQGLVSVDMLILLITSIAGFGGTLVAIDNMGQIGESLGYTQKSINTLVSLISIWSYSGRVLSGFASEILLKRYKFPRTLSFAVIIFVSCIGHLLIAFGVKDTLYITSIIIGFSNGAELTLGYAIVSELFGMKHFSTLYTVGSTAIPLGSYLLNIKLVGYMYDAQVKKKLKERGGKHVDLICTGVDCFKMSFLIITAVTIFGAIAASVLVWRTWDFYKSDVIHHKYRESLSESSENIDSKILYNKVIES